MRHQVKEIQNLSQYLLGKLDVLKMLFAVDRQFKEDDLAGIHLMLTEMVGNASDIHDFLTKLPQEK